MSLADEVIDGFDLVEFVVPMGFSLSKWNAYKKEKAMTNKDYHVQNPDTKWKVVHGHKKGHVGEPLPGLEDISYKRANKAHQAIVISQGR